MTTHHSGAVAEPAHLPLLLPLDEAICLIRLSRSQLYLYEAAGLVHFTRLGGAVRIARSEIDRIVRDGLPPLRTLKKEKEEKVEGAGAARQSKSSTRRGRPRQGCALATPDALLGKGGQS